ncbi:MULTISPECIES: NB-ARC domain-containing protein [unclassified Microcoleus]|uniref:NB-ARC domain-containing protein n=1 Tax=unclassified Microcoleus TaxID=2642155 RepID=UPI002FD03303
MDIAEVLTLADELIFAKTGKHLDYVQEAILRGTLQDTTYTQIAREVYSSSSHVRNVGSQLWKILSKELKKDITKNNFRTVLEKASFYNYQLAIVENVTGENITVNHNVNICHEKVRSPKTPQNPQQTAKQPRIDLDDAPEISTFFDRTSELSTLKQWILENRTRLITILGLSGSGKSAIALQLIQHIQYEFDCIIWRSLRDAPPLQTVQTDLIKFLSQQQETELPDLINYLRSHRCLIILDDVQTIFSSGQLAGNYKQGYENYGTFFKQIAESCHNSCLILLSWEKPREIAALESNPKTCQTLQLNGLGEPAREIFTEKGLAASEKWSDLIDLYRGNPLWLNTIAATIQDLFSGNVSEFLSYDSLVLGDLEYLLHQHFQRLSDSEKKVMSWLANQNKAVEISKKPALLELSPSDFLKAVESLRRRSLIEKVEKGDRTLFTVQPAIAEYVKSHIL